MSKKVVVLTPIHEAGHALLGSRGGIDVVVSENLSEAGIARIVADAHAILVRNAAITGTVIAAARHLQVVSRHGVGFDNVDVAALSARGIPLAITAGSNAVSVAEHTLYLMLALIKRGPFHDRLARAGEFQVRYRMHARDLAGKRLLIVGFGRIGSRVAPRALAFGMRVDVFDPYVDDEVIEGAGCTPRATLDEALPSADFVSLHCPLTCETRAMIGARALERLERGAWLINTARGGVVDEAALVEALRDGQLAGAGVDVFEVEPAARGNALFSLDNVIVSPHTAGVSLEASIRAATASVRHIFDAFEGRLDPRVVVNPEVLGSKDRHE